MMISVTIEAINDCLPQTQCTECGYHGCLPYAQAMQAKQALINRCPPGGTKTLLALSQLLGVDPEPYLEEMAQKTRPPQIATIKEAECIGCTKCIQACPVDAIIGTAKHMHVILSDECTGCGLCVEPCPVNCIEMTPVDAPRYQKKVAASRFTAKNQRLLKEKQKKEQLYQQKRQLASKSQSQQREREAKQAYILSALERAKKKPE